MERMTEWNDEQTRHAYYPRCFEEPCYGGGCKIKDCPFETAVCDRLAAYEETGLEPEAVETVKLALFAKHIVDLETINNTPISRLVELAEADKDGRCVVPPCKVGDMVWVIAHPWTGKLQKKPLVAYVNGMKLFTHGLYVNVLFDTLKINGTRDYEIISIGKTIFLTREEAEKALAERKGMNE